MATPNKAFLKEKFQKGQIKEGEALLDYYDLRLEEGRCPLCDAEVDLEINHDEHHQEVICDCGFHYCLTCQHIYS